MTTSRLDALQIRILSALAGMDPPWTLSGGAALAGFHLGHRETRDLDLFWHGHSTLPDADTAAELLRREGLAVHSLQRTPAFLRLRIQDGEATTIVDLIAEPVPVVESPRLASLGGVDILVDTAHEILVNKLCALLSRSELRDLVDLRALLDAGGALERALRDASSKDGGFSAATLGWILDELQVAPLGRASGLDQGAVDELDRWRADFSRRLALLSRPEGDGESG